MRRERPKVQDGDTRVLSVVREVPVMPCEHAIEIRSSWLVDTETVDRNRLGGRPKRRR